MSYGDAYFYRPQPQIIEQLTGYRHVIGQSFDERTMSLLKDIELSGRYAIPQLEGPEKLKRAGVSYLDAEYLVWKNPKWGLGGTWRSGATFTLSEFVDKYNKDEKNFVHAANGDRLRSTQDGRYFYLIRPKYAAKQWWTDILGIHKRPVDLGNGQSYTWPNVVFVDNVGADESKLTEVLKEMQLSGPVQEYGGGNVGKLYQAEWCEFFDVGRLVMGKDAILGGNLIGDWFAEKDVTEIVKRMDLIMLEAFAPWLNMRSSFKSEHSLNILKRAQSVVDAGKHLICVIHLSSKDTPERAAYEYARYLLIAGEKTSMRLVVDGVYSGLSFRIPEMDRDYGAARGLWDIDRNGILYRVFEAGTWWVDPKTYTAQFREHQPEPTDPIADLTAQVAAVLEREQQNNRLIAELQKTIEIQGITVAELQQRLAEPITFSGTVKI